MATTFKAGLIQTNVSNDMAENVAFVRAAGAARPRRRRRLHHDAGEYRPDRRQPHRDPAEGADRRRACHAGRGLPRSARETGAWFLLGSIHVRVPGEEQIRNRSYLIDSDGGIVASYDKIHMFDVAARRRRELSRSPRPSGRASSRCWPRRRGACSA